MHLHPSVKRFPNTKILITFQIAAELLAQDEIYSLHIILNLYVMAVINLQSYFGLAYLNSDLQEGG